MFDRSGFPRRIVCLTEETTETLYLLGEQDRIAGISGYTARPPEARRQKPMVSAFTSAKFDKILALEPDLVLGFSNLQADIARELISRGVSVMVFNQRSVEEILDMIRMLGRMVGAGDRSESLASELRTHLDAIAAESAGRRKPRVFFEEWHDPLISGIRWVEELVEIAGGEPVFPELRREHDARNRIVDPAAVAARDPEIVIASWCGRKVNKDWIRARPGWDRVSAVTTGEIHEVKSTIILQPGPAALTDGVNRLREIIARSTPHTSLSP